MKAYGILQTHTVIAVSATKNAQKSLNGVFVQHMGSVADKTLLSTFA